MIMKKMLSTVELVFEDCELFFASVLEYESSFADFPDVLIGNLNKKMGCFTTITFDKKASNLESFEILKV